MKNCNLSFGKIKAIIAVRPVSKYMAKKYGHDKAFDINFKKSLKLKQ